MRNASNNVLAGVFVIAGIVGFVLIILALSGLSSWFSSRTPYTVRFSLAEGASGLKPGSVVRVGGQQAGIVKNVAYVNDATSGAPVAVDVIIGLDSQVKLFRDASVQLELPLLGTVSMINIPHVGSPGAGVLNAGEIVDGQLAPPAFLAQAGYGDEQRTQVQQIIRSSARFVDDGQKLVEAFRAEAEPALSKINQTATDVRAIAAEVRTKLDTWTPRVDRVLANAEQFSADAQTTRKAVDDALARAQAFIDEVRAVVRDNRPRIDSVIKNADELVAKANAQVIEQVQATLEDGRRGLREFAEAGQRANALLAEASPDVRLTLANARLASDQLKLATAEVRRNPWRLLYQPGRKELAEELLFDASRSYAESVTQLRGVSASLEAATAAARTSPDAVNTQRLAELQQELTDSFAKYRRAEDQFLRRLLGEDVPTSPRGSGSKGDLGER